MELDQLFAFTAKIISRKRMSRHVERLILKIETKSSKINDYSTKVILWEPNPEMLVLLRKNQHAEMICSKDSYQGELQWKCVYVNPKLNRLLFKHVIQQAIKELLTHQKSADGWGRRELLQQFETHEKRALIQQRKGEDSDEHQKKNILCKLLYSDYKKKVIDIMCRMWRLIFTKSEMLHKKSNLEILQRFQRSHAHDRIIKRIKSCNNEYLYMISHLINHIVSCKLWKRCAIFWKHSFFTWFCKSFKTNGARRMALKILQDIDVVPFHLSNEAFVHAVFYRNPFTCHVNDITISMAGNNINSVHTMFTQRYELRERIMTWLQLHYPGLVFNEAFLNKRKAIFKFFHFWEFAADQPQDTYLSNDRIKYLLAHENIALSITEIEELSLSEHLARPVYITGTHLLIQTQYLTNKTMIWQKMYVYEAEVCVHKLIDKRLNGGSVFDTHMQSIRTEISDCQKQIQPPIILTALQQKTIAMMYNHKISVVQGPPGCGKSLVITYAQKLKTLPDFEDQTQTAANAGVEMATKHANAGVEMATKHANAGVEKRHADTPRITFRFPRILVLAEYNKACQNLRQRGVANVHTVCAFLADPFRYIENIDFVIIDEAGTVSLKHMAGLLRAIPFQTHICFVGDMFQMTPIGRWTGMIFADMVRTFPLQAKVELCTVFRTQREQVLDVKSGSSAISRPIQQNSSRPPRWAVEPTTESALQQLPKFIIARKASRLTDESMTWIPVSVFRYQQGSSKLDIRAFTLASLNKITAELDPTKDICVTARNSDVKLLNSYCHHKHKNNISAVLDIVQDYFGHLCTASCITPNTRVRMSVNLRSEKTSYLENRYENDSEDKSIQGMICTKGQTGTILSRSLSGQQYVFTIKLDGENQRHPTKGLLQKMRFGQFDLGYAATVHSIQGSEFPQAWVFLPDPRCPLLDARWLYVACTRAKKKLFVVGNQMGYVSAVIDGHNEIKSTLCFSNKIH